MKPFKEKNKNEQYYQDKDFDKICEILRFDFEWSNPDCLKGLNDIITATKQLIKSREKEKYCKCTNEHFINDVKLVCKNCNKTMKFKLKN